MEPLGKRFFGVTARALKKKIKGKEKKLFEASARCFLKMSQDVGVLEKFSKRLIKKYKAEDVKISKDVRKTLHRAEIAITTANKLDELRNKIKNVRADYFNDSETRVTSYRDKLDDIKESINDLEKGADLKDSPETITKGLKNIKDQLASAYSITKLKKHPKKIVDNAMKQLRNVSNQMQSLKKPIDIKRAFSVAQEVNEELSSCGDECIESARVVNQVIGEYSARFVDRELKILEDEVRAGPKLAKTIKSQKGRLIELYMMSQKLNPDRANDLQERMAFIFEDLNKIILVLKDPSSQQMLALGSDLINPDQIFSR